MTTTENTITATTVARKYAPASAVALFADMLMGTADVMGITGARATRMLANAFSAIGIDAGAAMSEYAYLTRR